MIPKYKDKICELCGKIFTPQGGVAKYCKSPIEKTCIVCGNTFTTVCHPKSSEVCDNPECKKKSGFVAASKSIHRICRICGEPFDAHSSRQLDCGKEITKICKICGNTYKSKCGLRWQEHTCDNPKCKAEYTHKGQQSHYLSTTKKCIWCGKEFHPINNKQLLCGKPHIVICKICGKQFEVDATYTPDTAPKYCSDECRMTMFKSRPNTSTPESIEKMKQTKRERYGDNYGAIIAEKARKTYQKRTGYSHQIYNIETHYKRAKTRNHIASKDGKSFDSYYECQVYDFVFDIPEINIDTQIPIKYVYQNTNHQTWVDFRINNILFEVKGSHLLLGVYSYTGIPIEIKLGVYENNNVVVITNNNKDTRDKINKYKNLIGIDINLFDDKLPLQDRTKIWAKIQQAIKLKIKFIDATTLAELQ